MRVLCALLAVALAVREEANEYVELSAEQEEMLDQEMKLVPAKISKAIRRAQRLSQEAMLQAEAKKANLTAAKQEAETKAAEALQQSEASTTASEEARKKREAAEAQQNEADKALESDNAAQAAWKTSNAKLDEMETRYNDEEGKYRELAERVKREVQRLMNEKLQAAKALEALKEEKLQLATEVHALKAEAQAKGGILMAAAEKAEQAQAAMEEADRAAEEAQNAAEAAQNQFVSSKAAAEYAEQSYLEAASEFERKSEMAKLVKKVRDSVQAFYDNSDAMTKSMEAALEGQQGAAEKKPAHELLRADPNTKTALVAYNEMVLTFRQLLVKSKDFYTYVAGGVHEIHENAEAAIQLQCDPEEELELAAKESGDQTDLHEKCGQGVWRDLELEQQRFPHLEGKHVDAQHVVASR